ncbi:AcrR family transcriptional regulator [Friedmanniella endophytica]|uniref:AcrR family transcriptional regulator n=1 Tax=Microlunatus kandeliicorticis TaxID=1759536 RepID=A0A7W3IRG7_9ACTN|nr:TetR/AcrR family transcriptional regulator [Microlunatus kandeliicorticis]MBA8793850.1 AcrR family transcriptional regulator [Microlunatus kandeliicorticis]
MTETAERPAPTRRPPRSEVRADVLAAATRSFLTRGYRRTSLNELAAEAGYSKGAVYSNFGGKPELFAAVVAARASDFADRALAQFDAVLTEGEPSGSTDVVAARLAGSLTTDDQWPVLLEEFRALAAEDPQLRAVYTQWRTAQRDQLAAQIAARRAALGRPDAVDTQAAATLLMLLVNTLALERRAAPDALPASLVSSTLELALRSIVR